MIIDECNFLNPDIYAELLHSSCFLHDDNDDDDGDDEEDKQDEKDEDDNDNYYEYESDQCEEEEEGGGGQHLHDGYMSSSQICRSAHKVRPVLSTTQTDTQTTAHVCEIVLPFVVSNYKSKRNSSVVYTKLQAGKPFNKSMLCTNICGNGDFVKTAGAHDMTLLRRDMVHLPNGVYRPTRTNVRVQRVPVHQLACHNTLVELTQMVDTVDIDTTELARYVVQNMPIPNSYALCANVRTTYCAGTC